MRRSSIFEPVRSSATRKASARLAFVVTKATLADAFAIALKRLGLAVTRTQTPSRRRDTDDREPGADADRNER